MKLNKYDCAEDAGLAPSVFWLNEIYSSMKGAGDA